jgi:hypothetical protein
VEIAFIFLLISIPLWLNVLATKAVIRDEGSERKQKIAQLLFVWLIPLIGAVIALAVHRPNETPSRKYREPLDPGDDFGFSGRAANGLSRAIDDD